MTSWLGIGETLGRPWIGILDCIFQFWVPK